MPFLGGVESVFLCGAKSLRDFDEYFDEMPSNRSSNGNKQRKGARNAPTPTRTSQLRAGLNAKERRRTTDAESSLETSIDEQTEEQVRIQTMEYRQEIQSLKNHSEDLIKENEQLKETLKEKETSKDLEKGDTKASDELLERLTGLEREREELLRTIGELRTVKETADKQFATLEKERETQDMLLEETRDEVEKYKTENEYLKKIHTNLSEESEKDKDMSKENTSLMATPVELESLVTEELCMSEAIPVTMTPSSSVPDDEFSELGEKVKRTESELSKFKNENYSLTAEISKVKNENDNLPADVSNFKNEIDVLSAELSRVKNENDSLTAESSKLKNENENKNTELANIQNENNSLAAESSKLQLENNKLEAEHDNLRSNIDEQTSLISNLEDDLVAEKERYRSMEQKLNDVQGLVNSKNSEILNLSSNVENLGKQLEDSNRELSTLEEIKNLEILNLSSNVENLGKQLEDSNRELSTLEEIKNLEILNLSSNVENLGKELETSKRELNTFQETETQRGNDLQQSVKQAQTEFEKLKNDSDSKIKLVEDQLMKTRQQKEQFEDTTYELQKQVDNLTDEIKTLQELNEELSKKQIVEEKVFEIEEVEFEQAQNNPFLERTPSTAEPEPEVKILRQQIDQQQTEMENLESSFKSDICELQNSAEFQEQAITKLESENSLIRKQTYELNETVLVQEDKIRSLTNENLILSEQLQEHKEHQNELTTSQDLIIQKQKNNTESLLRAYDEEIEAYKNKLDERDEQMCEMAKTKASDITDLESQLVTLQTALDFKSKDCKNLYAECERLKKYKEQEQLHRDEQESYLLREIERTQQESKQRMNTVMEDKDKQIANLISQQEEKLLEIEIEYEQLKSNELSSLREDFSLQMESLLNERNDLVLSLKKMESLLSEDRNRSNGHVDRAFSPDTDILDRDSLYEHVLSSLSVERQNHQDSSQEMLNMLTKLEQKFTEDCKNTKTNENSELNNTWPQINQSEPAMTRIRRLSAGTGYSNGVPDHFLKDDLEKIRTDISVQLKDLDNSLLSSDYRVLSRSLNGSLNETLYDTEDGLHSRSYASSASSNSFVGINRLYSPSPPRSPSQSPLRREFKDSGVSFDYPPSKSINFRRQLRTLFEMFDRLEQQCRALENENIEFSHETWYRDLQLWKQRANSRLNFLQQRILGHDDNDSALMKSIVFRPTDSEVRKIIADVNDRYDMMATGIDEY